MLPLACQFEYKQVGRDGRTDGHETAVLDRFRLKYWDRQTYERIPDVSCCFTLTAMDVVIVISLSLSLQSSAVEQVLNILMDILSWEIAEAVSLCLPLGL